MKNQITPQRIANQARMRRKKPQNSILLVEGSTDTRVVSNFVDETCCDVVYAVYKDKLISALQILDHSKEQGVLGIADADYWHVNKISPKKYSNNLFVTDTHDIDTMILLSSALEKMLSEYARQSKLESLGKSVRQILAESGVNIGYVRWVSEKHNHSIDFKDLCFYNFIDKSDLQVNTAKLYKEIKRNPKNKHIDVAKVISQVNTLVQLKEDKWNICQGHDLIEILTIGLKEVFGNHTNTILNSDIVSRNLRLSCNLYHFLNTNLYASIEEWEKANSPFKVLKKNSLLLSL